MPGLIEDYEYIARRAKEIRAARWVELGVSPPVWEARPPPAAPPDAPDGKRCDGFRYAPGFEPAGRQSTPAGS
jgi:hypothetical protein